MIAELKKRYGNKCSCIKLNYEGTCVNTPSVKLRFCEAVNHSFHAPLLLNSSNLACKGSQRSFGLSLSDEHLIKHISEESKISTSIVKMVLQDTPVFDQPVKNIFLGIQNQMEEEIRPDMFILQIKPKDVMELIKQYILKTSKFPIIKTHPFLSVCGGVLVSTIKQKLMSISFGCSDSRRFGGVDDSDVIVGLPFNICKQLLN